MRILSFSNTYRPTVSGVVTSMEIFRRGLLEAGHDVHVIAPEYSYYEDEEPYIYRLPALDLPGDFDFALAMPFRARVSLLVKGIKPDVIHCQHPFLTGDLAASFAQELRIPLIYTFHSRYNVITERYLPAIADLADLLLEDILENFFEKCALIIAPTPTIKEYIQTNYNPKAPIDVIPTPVDLSDYCAGGKTRSLRHTLGLEGRRVLLYIGRLAREKNLDFLLEVFKLVLVRRPDTRLLIVGDGPERDKIEKHAARLGVGDQVIITGFVNHGDVGCYAALGDLFVFPSTAETQGLVLVEAMAAGVPAVAVEAPGCSDVLSAGGGLLLKLDEVAFCETILELLADETQRTALSKQAIQVADSYSLPVVTERLVKTYEKAITQFNVLRPVKS